MVNFKQIVDQYIWDNWGIQVEHICAMQDVKKNEMTLHEKHTNLCSTECKPKESSLAQSKDFQCASLLGVKNSSTKKLTYQDIFYRQFQRGKKKGRIYGFPIPRGNWCNNELKMAAIKRATNF